MNDMIEPIMNALPAFIGIFAGVFVSAFLIRMITYVIISLKEEAEEEYARRVGEEPRGKPRVLGEDGNWHDVN